MPDLGYYHCRKKSAPRARVLRRKRTIIMRDYNGITVINHLNEEQLNGVDSGGVRLVQFLIGALATYIQTSTVQSHSSVSEFLID